MQEIYYPSSDGKTNIHACIWQAEGEPKAVLQIIHGMAEYASRYAPLAEFLNKQGITVCAEDHLGHGKSVCSDEDLGYFAAKTAGVRYLPTFARLPISSQRKTRGFPIS